MKQFLPPNMGKPSSSSCSKKALSECKSRSIMNISMKLPKMLSSKRKTKRKRNKNIKKLFEHLRNESATSNSVSEASVISLDSSLQANTEPLNTSQSKRKCSPEPSSSRKKRKSENIIEIKDEDLIINKGQSSQTPNKEPNIQCSTPILKKDSKMLSQLLINSFPKNNNSTIVNLNKEIKDLTTQINRDSYLTIDLTEGTETGNSKILHKSISNVSHTVIDLIDNTDVDCSIISVASEPSLSGESDITVLHNPKRSNKTQIRKIANGIAQLNSSEKGKLLEYITETIFNGCNVAKKSKKSVTNVKESIADSHENECINKILLGTSPSRNSVGSNIYRPERANTIKSGLRMIIIDGSNVAMQHGMGKVFSVEGLKICIDYFIKRGHRVKAFVPRFRCKFGKSSNPRLLDCLEREGSVVYTPSREIKGKMITPYDDRYIIQCAAEFDGVVVTGDNYRDLIDENPKWRFVIENRLLPFTWVDNMIMFPKDPLGRNGPTLQQFLNHTNK